MRFLGQRSLLISTRPYIYIVGRCVTKLRTYIFVLGRQSVKVTGGGGGGVNFCFFLYLVAMGSCGSCGSMEVNGFLVPPPFAVSNGKSIIRD